jgi:hypothetical protein
MLLAGTGNNLYLEELNKSLDSGDDDKKLFKSVVNAPFKDRRHSALLGLGIVVLLLVNKKARTIDRIALSDTELAQGAVEVSVKRFREIKIPLNYKGNFIAEAVRSGRYQQTSDWQYLFIPALKPEEARLNQAGAGIGCSFVYPLKNTRDGGAMIFSYFIPLNKIEPLHRDFMYRYSKLVSQVLSSKA